MGRNSDSDLLKNYCENHQGELFDFGYLSSHHFQMIEYNNLRMIVSRLEKQGILHKISKGIFIIGETSKDSKRRRSRRHFTHAINVISFVAIYY